MTTFGFDTAMFPRLTRGRRAEWAPILLEPIVGSYERLVVGVAVVADNAFHLEMANAAARLRCLYGPNADALMVAIELIAQNLEEDMARRGDKALKEPRPYVTGMSIGDVREGEGEELEDIATNWMRALSSLYEATDPRAVALAGSAASAGELAVAGDALSNQVMKYVTQRDIRLLRFFDDDIRLERRRRASVSPHDVIIDFSGSRLTANFGSLNPRSLPASVGKVKHRLWDLKVHRDQKQAPEGARSHELILQVPDPDDAALSPRQRSRVRDASEGLERQADQERLRLRTFNTVEQIGAHILKLEAA